MTAAPFPGPVLVIAPHADDEVLGAGGTIARLTAAGVDVSVVIVTRGVPPMYSEEQISRAQTEIKAAHEVLGVKETIALKLPAAGLDGLSHADLNRSIGQVVRDIRPETLLLPFVGDIHLDHQLVFLSSMVAARPHSASYPAQVLCYETLSETNWNAPHVAPSFTPNVFVDITETLERKLEAMTCFASQLYNFPHERSLEALRALAMLRGSTVHQRAAEAFVSIRQVL